MTTTGTIASPTSIIDRVSLHPLLHIGKPVVKVVLEFIGFIDCTEALLPGIWQIAHDLFVILVCRSPWCDLELYHMATHAKWKPVIHRVLLLLLDLASCGHSLRLGKLLICLSVMCQDLVYKVVWSTSVCLRLLLSFLSLRSLLLFGFAITSKFFNLCASLCCRNHFFLLDRIY